MLIIVLLVLLYFLIPVVIIWLTHLSKTIQKIGAVVIAYVTGLVFGNVGILPNASAAFREILAGNTCLPSDELMTYAEQGLIPGSDLLVNQIAGLQHTLLNVVIPLAIPLLLFSLNLKRWLRLAKGAMFSLLLGLSSLLVVVVAGYFLFGKQIMEGWKVAGMLIGIYTGGAPNLAAISTALNVEPNQYILTNTYDMVLGAFCLIFLLTSAQRLFNLFLPRFSDSHRELVHEQIRLEQEDIDNYRGMLTEKGIPKLVIAFGLSVLIAAAGGGLGLLFPESAQTTVAILSITTFSLAASMVRAVNRLEKTFQFGMYFIIVFSLIVASMGDLRSMFSIEFLNLFFYVMLSVFGSMLVHVFLSWLFRVDSDTTIITITALTYSPPFVPVVAGALKNKDVIISGLTVGILGYAFGNYLGIALAFLLKGF
ncbi:DUF819 family protein [Gaoshiqia sediminis]|uniref:DUF819 family protein n=1 Tax=Gaoshiqia sediminis TaxID=2986998 RepID=A0AA42C4L1_9BACT|nr:DUF819 family protein [Gaoshiqia sediminis]MCW0481893.1 DUF819 family protein [Gaoshiqia sediminis]